MDIKGKGREYKDLPDLQQARNRQVMNKDNIQN